MATLGNNMSKVTDKCIVCEKPVDNNGKCESNCTTLRFGFGSKLDTDTIEKLTLCDECAKQKASKGIITIKEM